MSTEEDSPSWFSRLRQFLTSEPQNRDELISLLRDARERELIDNETLNMTEGVIQFAQLRVRDIMVPKTQMVSIPHQASLAQVIDIITESGHSRFPVYSEDKERIEGILHAKDLLRYQNPSNTEEFDIDDIIRSSTFVPESKRLDLLLSEFRSHRNHMAIVVDEYGEVSGFVTIEDIIEQIIGDIEDEFDIEEEDNIKVHRNQQYIIKGHTPIEDVNEILHTQFDDSDYDTIGGVILNRFGYLPKQGESIDIDGWQFKVINADARRIKLLSCIHNRNESTL
ncbi:HlyC/CorC family transporter [Legionella sp. W05-934-2]|uniref:HlyC/CorC family transporter n=1 Tax=Legionella sp. W05-934-2 TaxID=1198649 RepID=UPI003461C781